MYSQYSESDQKDLKRLREEVTGLRAKKVRLQETTDKVADKIANKKMAVTRY